MFLDFHYYATYCAAYLAGYSHEESVDVAYWAAFVDNCTITLLNKINGPQEAATTQYIAEMVDDTDTINGLHNIARIWCSYHFLPYDLYAKSNHRPKRYMDRYRLICKPNGDLLVDTVNLAKGADLQAVGIAMHVLADTWSHSYFAGIGSNVINDINSYFYEIIDKDGVETERKVEFKHIPGKDDFENSRYNNSIAHDSEASIMCIGHGRLGHMPDYSFIKYKYMPAWGDYEVIIKDNPTDYFKAFCQMIYALKYLRGEYDSFYKDTYETECITPWKEEILSMMKTRQYDHDAEWKEMCTKISGHAVEAFDITRFQAEYTETAEDLRHETALGRFFLGAIRHKSMVTHKIFESGNMLAGYSVDLSNSNIKNFDDIRNLLNVMIGGQKHD